MDFGYSLGEAHKSSVTGHAVEVFAGTGHDIVNVFGGKSRKKHGTATIDVT